MPPHTPICVAKAIASVFIFMFLLVCQAVAGHSIIIHKSSRLLEVYDGPALLHAFPVGLGNTPVGDKIRSGDGKTPEGLFRVCVKNAKSRYYLSLGLSYPAPDDAARGLRDGIISQSEHDRILAAHRLQRTPPWNTGLGGEIFIHGCGASSDWTLGCVALENDAMKTLFDLVEVGTPVEIRP